MQRYLVDEIGKEVIKRLFKTTCGIELKEIYGQYEHSDLSGYNDRNEIITVEAKFRQGYNSTELYDNACDEYKVIKNRGMLDDGTFDKAYLYSVYNDGIVRGTNLTSDYQSVKKYLPKKTVSTDNTRIVKPLASFTNFKSYALTSYGLDLNEIKAEVTKEFYEYE